MIRTYNFPDGRITDHRIKFTVHQLEAFLDGDIDEMIDALITFVQDEGVEDLYIQKGEASLGTTKDSSVFDKSMKRIYSMLTSAKKIHSDIMQNIDSKFTKGMESAFTSLNNVNGEGNPYKSKYTTKTETRRVSRGYTNRKIGRASCRERV